MALMYVLLIFTFYSLGKNSDGFTEDRIMEDIAKACPFNSLCSMEATKNILDEKAEPCCGQCSCDENCVERQNCCPFFIPSSTTVSNLNNAGRSTNGVRQQECILPVWNPSVHLVADYRYNNYGIHTYHTFATCPENYDNHDIKTLCERKIATTVEDVQIVSDHQQFAYKNKYCAICNDVKEYIEWDLIVDCDQTNNASISLALSDELNTDSFKNCMQTSKPPTETLEKVTGCKKGYNTCNTTGLWQTYDDNIYRACELYSLPYTHHRQNMMRPTNYKNIHCFLCNNRDSERMTDTCYLEQYVYGGRGISELQFTGMLNFKIFTSADQNIHSRQCRQNEIYDAYNVMCRRLHCPLLYMPIYGECVEKVWNSTGYGIAITVNLLPIPELQNRSKSNNNNSNISPSLWSDYDITDVYQLIALTTETYNALKLQNKKCGLCSINMYKKEKQDTFYYTVVVFAHTTKSCSASTILNLAETFQNSPPKPISILSLTIPIHFQPELTLEVEKEDDILSNNFKSLYTIPKKNCKTYYFIRETMNCPRIELSETEFKEFVNRTKYNGKVSKVKYQGERTTNNTAKGTTNMIDRFRVCVDDYLTAQTNAATQIDKRTWFVSMIAWYILVIYLKLI